MKHLESRDQCLFKKKRKKKPKKIRNDLPFEKKIRESFARGKGVSTPRVIHETPLIEYAKNKVILIIYLSLKT